jgi:DNA-binding transcriptional MerR regulator
MKTAALDKVEILAVVIEEQRLRIDSMIQGSTKIYPIYKEMKRINIQLKEIQEFLQLPQSRNLHAQLHELSFLIEELSQRVIDIVAMFQQQQTPRLESLTSKLELAGNIKYIYILMYLYFIYLFIYFLEARIETCLVDRERIGYLMAHCDTTRKYHIYYKIIL